MKCIDLGHEPTNIVQSPASYGHHALAKDPRAVPLIEAVRVIKRNRPRCPDLKGVVHGKTGWDTLFLLLFLSCFYLHTAYNLLLPTTGSCICFSDMSRWCLLMQACQIGVNRCAILENVEGCSKRVGQGPDPDGYKAGWCDAERGAIVNWMASLAIWPTKLRVL